MTTPIAVLSDDLLLILCNAITDNAHKIASGTLEEGLHTLLQQTTVSQVVGGRTQLQERFPIFGKDGHFYTKDPIGVNWGRNKRTGDMVTPNKKRVTIPTFDIVACPQAMTKMFGPYNQPDVRAHLIREIFLESIRAMENCELDYFHGLLEAAADYNQFYPKISTVELDSDLLMADVVYMRKLEITPRAIFMNGIGIEMLLPAAEKLNVPIITRPHWGPDVYVFGQPTDPAFALAQFVDNGNEVDITRQTEPSGKYWTIQLRQSENVGLLVGAPGVLKISRDLVAQPVAAPSDRIRAYIIGEEGADVVSVI